MINIAAFSIDDLIKAGTDLYSDDVTIAIIRPIDIPAGTGISFTSSHNLIIEGFGPNGVLNFHDNWPGDWSKVTAGNGIELDCGNVVMKNIHFNNWNGWGSVIKRHANLDSTKSSDLLIDTCYFNNISTIIHPFRNRNVIVTTAGSQTTLSWPALDPRFNGLKVGSVLPEGTVVSFDPWTANLAYTSNCVGGSGDTSKGSRIDCFNSTFTNCCTNNSYAHVNYTTAVNQIWKGNTFNSCGSMQAIGSPSVESWHAWIDNKFLNSVKVSRGDVPLGNPYLILGNGGPLHMTVLGNHIEGDYSSMYYYAYDNPDFWQIDYNQYINVNQHPENYTQSTWSYDYTAGHYIDKAQWLAKKRADGLQAFDAHSTFT